MTGKKAPNLKDLEIKQKEIVMEKKPMTWKFIGCGGFGSNMVSELTDTDIEVIDTSDSNTFSGKFTKIPGCNGSGKFRPENIDNISSFITKYVNENEFSDMSIVVFSLAGGSGSVIGPLLLKEIYRQKKLAIVVCVSSVDSNIDAKNSLNTLKTLENIAGDNIYIPTMIFDNVKGRKNVDEDVVKTLKTIDKMFATDAHEMDVMDKRHFFSPNKLIPSITGGIKILSVSEDDGNNPDSHISILDTDSVDSTLLITPKEYYFDITMPTQILYEGYAGISDPIVMSIGYQIDPSFIDKLNATVHSFESNSSRKQSSINIEYDDGSTTTNGIVL
jgi:hypothetical protein